MAVDLNKIELGAGELLIYHFANNNPLYWDSGLLWDAAYYWPDEWQVGTMVNAEFGGKMIGKDIIIGAAVAAVKSATIGAEGLFKATMIESALEQLVIAIGGDPDDIITATSADKFVFGGSAKQVIFGLRYSMPKLESPTKRYILELFKGVPQGIDALPFAKTEERSYEVTFNLLGDKNRNWQLGTFYIEK